MHTELPTNTSHFTAFADHRCVATGPLARVIPALMAAQAANPSQTLWLFEDASGKNLELDLRGGTEEITSRLLAQCPAREEAIEAPPQKTGPGRPKLGVVAREVTLLPQHWEWLAAQPGGASVALRKLVHAARKASAPQDRARQSLEAAHRVMTTLGGSYAGFEEATRALFKADFAQALACVASWPADLRDYVKRLLDIAAQAAADANQAENA